MWHDELIYLLQSNTPAHDGFNQALHNSLCKLMKENNTFPFVFDLDDSDIESSSYDLADTGKTFWKEGILKQPYPITLYVFNKRQEAILSIEGQDGDVFVLNYSKENNQTLGRSIIVNIRKGNYYQDIWARDKTEYNKNDKEQQEIINSASNEMRYLFFYFTMLINTKHSIKRENVKIPEKLNKARTKRGKPPLHDYTIISLSPTNEGTGRTTGTHASPRPHWRRGHIRRLHTGAVVPVMPCLVNAISGEGCTKTYEVRG